MAAVSRFSLSDQTKSHGLVRCGSDCDCRSPAFVKFHDVRIEPGTVFDIFPGEQFVIAWRNRFEVEFTGLAGPCGFEKVDSVTAGRQKHDADIWNGLTLLIAHGAVQGAWTGSNYDVDLTVWLPVDMQTIVQEILAPKPHRLYVETIGEGVHQELVISGGNIVQRETPVRRRCLSWAPQHRNVRIRPQPYLELCPVCVIFRFLLPFNCEVTGNVESRHDRYHDILQIRVPHVDWNASSHVAGLGYQHVFSGNDIAHFEFACRIRGPVYPGEGIVSGRSG